MKPSNRMSKLNDFTGGPLAPGRSIFADPYPLDARVMRDGAGMPIARPMRCAGKTDWPAAMSGPSRAVGDNCRQIIIIMLNVHFFGRYFRPSPTLPNPFS